MTEEQLARFRYAMRRTAARITSDCERMLEWLHQSDRAEWRTAVGEALLAGRQLLALPGPAHTESGDADRILAAARGRLREPRQRITDAMSRLLKSVPITVEEELVLHDAAEVRRAASDLLTMESAPAGATPADPAAQAAIPARVLVVDDDASIRRVMRAHLTRFGYTVFEAANGQEALSVARREPLDLVLTDINMPDLDGIALLEELKGSPETRELPVIVISSQDDLASVVACIERGADDHLGKPFEPLLLRARARTSIERKRMRDLERDFVRRVGHLTAAAEAVEAERYVPGTLDVVGSQEDELSQLARVFDRMVTGLRAREERLQRRLGQLRDEVTGAATRANAAATRSDRSPFASGETLASRYEILSELGAGGMGMVYHARDLQLGEEVAVKVVRRDLLKGDSGLVDRLKSEIRLTRRVSHRNVVRAHDLGEWNGTYFITMEYVDGITLEELIDRRGRLTVESTLAIGTQLAEALTVAHEQQILHRDIKPANLFIDRQGVVKVMDFGIARLMEAVDNVTQGGFVIGTPQYMAPEQLMGRPLDARSDLFAAGVVLYECLAGRPPFIADSIVTLLARLGEGDAPRLSALVPHVPRALETLIHRQLQFDPDQRTPTARELATRLAEIEHGPSSEPVPLLDTIDLQIIGDINQ